LSKLLIFGGGAECARVVREAERDGRNEVIGIVLDDGANPEVWWDRPVFTLPAAREKFARTEVMVFACGDARFMNQERLGRYLNAKRSGFLVASIVSPTASVSPGVKIRENAFIDADARVLDGANLGANAWVMKGASVAPNVRVGSSTWIAEGCLLEEGSSVGKNCVLSSGVILRSNVAIASWSVINRRMSVEASITSPTIFDPRFRAGVVIRGVRSS
jgi:carbonic anhydrase/acetyltransferase-like protein (isoleucine patch superfamily)